MNGNSIPDEADDQDENGPLSPPTGGHVTNSAQTATGGPAVAGSRPAPGPIRGSSSNIHLWQFVKELLNQPQYSGCIDWVERDKGIFKIVDSVRLAELWGKTKKYPAIYFDKLSRSFRQYYKKRNHEKSKQTTKTCLSLLRT